MDDLIGSVFDVHRDILSTWQEHNQLRNIVHPTQPVPRELVDRPDANGKPTGPRSGDFCYDVPMKEELETMLAHNSSLISQLIAASDAWAKERPAPGSSKTIYADIADGRVLREHPRLGTQADRSDGSVRLAVILYYDDLEVCNPLGAFHGRHKLGMFYWSLVNLDQTTRFSFSNIHLMTVALASDIDYYGIQQIVSGKLNSSHTCSHAHIPPTAHDSMLTSQMRRHTLRRNTRRFLIWVVHD